MCFTGSELADKWDSWESAFSHYYLAAELNRKLPETQVAALLHCAGQEAHKIFKTFTFADTDTDSNKNYERVLKKFKDYCRPKTNETYETYRLWHRTRLPGESFDSCATDLPAIVSGCN